MFDALVVEQGEPMLTSISNLDLQRVVGGDGEKQVAKPAESLLGRVAKTGVKIAGKAAVPLTVGTAGYDAYKGYEAARNRGAGQGAAIQEAGLEGLNSVTLGLSN